MKTEMKILSLLLVLALLLPCLFACDPEVSESSAPSDASDVSENGSTPEESKPEEPDGAELYKAARERFEALKNFGIKREYTSTAVAGAETVSESGEVEESYLSYGEEGMKSLTKAKYTSEGDRNVEYTKTNVDGKSYLVMGEDKFVSELTDTEESFLILDETLYSDIKVTINEDNTVIKFYDASKVDCGITFDEATLISAEGEAVLDKNGNLVSWSYKAEYKNLGILNNFECKMTVTEYAEDSLPEIKAPEDADTYMAITDIDAPLYFSDAMYELEHLDVFNYNNSVVMVSDIASDLVYTMAQQTSYFDYDSKFVCKNTFSQLLETKNDSSVGVTESTLVDGKMKMVFNDGEPTEEKYNSKQIDGFKSDIFSSILFCAPDFSHVSDMSVSFNDGYVTVTVKGNEAYDDLVREKVCMVLFGQPASYIDDIASSYTLKELEMSITIDAISNLPVAYNIDYKGIHRYWGNSYELSLEMISSFEPGSPDAYYNVTEEHHPDFDAAPEKEEEAKPLFYKVTGANGKTLWLLGTIHAGDNRTAYLPKEIYDAFDSADAVAFEIDMKEFERLMEEDEKLNERAHKFYYYTDRKTTLSNKIDPELNTKVEEILAYLGLGGYGDYASERAEKMKPATMSSYITSIYDAHALALYSSKGVDERLIERAYDAEQKVYSIEAIDRQFDVLDGLSEEFIEFMLKLDVYSSRIPDIVEQIELYDAWCAGDYDKLVEALNADEYEEVDVSELTEEELALYNEYLGFVDEFEARDNMLTTERDALMLDTIKGYLESEETVFVAVGLAHLLDSETGLVKTLAEAGYTVELVEYAA